VTEPVARTSVRRTVRMAVALVAGQAALCAVIGWVTFGAGHPDRPGNAAQAVDPLADPPQIEPPATAAPAPPGSATVPPAPPAAKASTSTRASSHPAAPKPHRSTPARAAPVPAPRQSAAAPRPSPPGGQAELQHPSPAPTGTQSGAVLGEPCDPVGAPGLTVDHIVLHCILGIDGNQSWQIN
jgi:hypothetical protein